MYGGGGASLSCLKDVRREREGVDVVDVVDVVEVFLECVCGCVLEWEW